MDMSEVKAFNAELSGLYDNKPPISKAKMSAITRGAIKAIKFYKHVVHSVEKFIQKCKPEYKVPGLYVIDSIVRQSRHQFGQDKDVFAPRFAKNMQQTFANLFRCPPEDKRNIIRVLNLWQKNNVFSADVTQPLMDMADPNHPLHQEIQQQQNNASNGGSLNASHVTTESKGSPAPQQHSPQPLHSPMGDSFQDQSSQPSNVKFNRKLLNDFEYDSEDDGGTPGGQRHEPPPQQPSGHHQHQSHQHQTHQTQNPADALGSILTNPEIMRQLQSLQAQMQLMTGMQGIQMPNMMPLNADMQQMGQNQNPNLPFLGGHPEQQKQTENKDDMANESDIEFVETGPQVIEIPDANDSRSPSPSRRRRSRSPRRSRRRGSRSRSRSPRRRRGERERERDRDRDREKERERDKEKSYKEREAEKEKQREREKKGLPPIKQNNLSVCSTTLWVGHLSKLATQEELSDLFGGYGGVVSIDVVGPRGCAFVVMERRRDAHKAKAKLDKHKLHSKEITVAWAPGKGVKGREWKDYWEAEYGVSYLPWEKLEQLWHLGLLSMDALEEGGAVDEETLPPWLPPRIIPKTLMEGPMAMMAAGMPPVTGPGLLPSLPPGIPSLPGLNPAGLLGAMPPGAPPGAMALGVPRMPMTGMTPGIPPGIAPGMPPGIRPPSIPAGVPGLQTDAGLPPQVPLLGFPGGMAPGQPLAQGLGQGLGQGMVGGFLGGLVRLGGLLPPPPPIHAQQQMKQQEVTHTDDAMDLDTEDNHAEEPPPLDVKPDPNAPLLMSLPEQLQALLSKPPPNFNASEPPPAFNAAEPPPFNMSVPPPTEDKNNEEDKKERDRDRDRRDRDRDRDRDRGGDRRDRRDRGDRDRRDRDRDRGRDRGGDDRRGGDERRGGERDRDRGRDRRERDRDGNRDRDRFGGRDNRDQSREKSPRANASAEPSGSGGEKTLQERLWEMANGKPASRNAEPEKADQSRGIDRDGFDIAPRLAEPSRPVDQSQGRDRDGFDIAPRLAEDMEQHGPPLRDLMPMRHDHPPPLLETPDMSKSDSGWTQLPPPRAAPPPMGPTFRAEFRLRGQPRAPIRGPWMDGPGPNFGPRFNGMGPPFRPPFEGGPPLFDGPPRMPFNRMPFDGPRPPFDQPPFDQPPFDGDMPFDGPPPEFFDRNNRRFDEREPFDRNWNGNNRDRNNDPEWNNDRRNNEWDDRRNRDRRTRDHEERFNRDRGAERGDRRRNFDDRRPSRDDRNSKDERHPRDEKKEEKTPTKDDHPKEEKAPRNRDKDRKSRWGAAEENPQVQENTAEDNQESVSKAAEENPEISSQSEQGSEIPTPREEPMDYQQDTSVDNSTKDSYDDKGTKDSYEDKEDSFKDGSDDKRSDTKDSYEDARNIQEESSNQPEFESVSNSNSQPCFEEQNYSMKEQVPAADDRFSQSIEPSDNSESLDKSFQPPDEMPPEIDIPPVEKEPPFEPADSLDAPETTSTEERDEPQAIESNSQEISEGGAP